jgi:hypothetical protein
MQLMRRLAVTAGKGIPREVAKFCDEIRAEYKQRGWFSWFSSGGLNCWGYYRFSRGDGEKMCLSSEGGCAQVNKRYKLRQGDKQKEVTDEH